jgi:AcrR family transcriptional regulator
MAEPRSYHHGDLRQALVAAALRLLAERGLEGVTLRETARRAGVSHAAPYHHFPDKAHLIEALAITSFERFAAALRTAWEATPGPSIAKFQAVGLAYVSFALEHPEEFKLMNRPELRRAEGAPSTTPTPVQAAAGASYDVLLHAIRASQADGFIESGDPAPYALTAWASVHGLCVLWLDGLLDARAYADGGAGLADVVTRTLGGGLLARSDGS